jgi:Flp pilus assembly secretin CpaC
LAHPLEFERAADMIRTAKTIVGVTLALALFGAQAIAAPAFRVALDQASPIVLREAASAVVIGNPAIAGVSMQNDRMLFVTGRAYGTTNLIVLGANGRPIYESRVTVGADESGSTVMVTKGTSTVRHECAPLCRRTPDMADDKTVFEEVTGAATSHASNAKGSQ